jgi:20S proteasome subunit beta 3
MNLFELREERKMEPKAFSTMLSNLLYEKRFGPWFVEPVVAGLDKGGKPFISAMDLIGAECFAKDFVVSGTCPDNMYGMCESLYREDMDEDALFETLSQCLLSAVDRDAISGWGAVVHIIGKEGTTTKRLRGRPD